MREKKVKYGDVVFSCCKVKSAIYIMQERLVLNAMQRMGAIAIKCFFCCVFIKRYKKTKGFRYQRKNYTKNFTSSRKNGPV